MERFIEKIKGSFFVINKLYMILIFLLLTIQDATLGVYYFIISAIIYTWKVLTSRVPIEINKDFSCKTFVYKKLKNRKLKLVYGFQEIIKSIL